MGLLAACARDERVLVGRTLDLFEDLAGVLLRLLGDVGVAERR